MKRKTYHLRANAPRSLATWIGGLHAVQETLSSKPGSVLELWVDRDAAADGRLAAVVRAGREAGLGPSLVDRRELDRVCPGRHQGVAAKVAPARKLDLADFLAGLPEGGKGGAVLLALDQVQDPHNLGAVARSAVNLGAAGIIIPDRRASPVTPAAVSASAGAIQKIPVFSVVNLSQALKLCREAGFWVYGADASGEPAWKAAINLPLVLVIGSEGSGMRDLVRSSCDGLLSIPQSGAGVESLNASCAASVLLYEIARRGALPGENG
ncbi:MAG: 23S rRNA (guanosine(2251)-2'-O)-methyltransferase RlmB [Elusimicrobia bacterium]|nr:23S rRNA (guanosine(2251)-2'-O)-methyltransferase RlmB [Elusimicrobiota bacterium]